MNILITGAGGFIGSNTLDYLVSCRHSILALDNFSTGRMENLKGFNGNRIKPCDIRDEVILETIFDEFRPDAVLHLAAQSAITTAWENPEKDLDINGIGTLNLLRLSRRFGVKRFVFASSSAVYGKPKASWITRFGSGHIFDPDTVKMDEECHTEPDTPYGVSKLAAEHYIRMFFPNHLIMRYANIYGPRQQPIGQNQVIALAFRHFINGEEFKITGDGHQKRDFVFVGDICKANYLALTGNQIGTFNVASGKSYSVLQVLAEIEKHYGVAGYRWEHSDTKDERGSVWLNARSFEDRLGWSACTSLAEGIRKTAEWWDGVR